MGLPTIFDTRRPRADVEVGTIRDDEFMADLSRVVNGTAAGATWRVHQAMATLQLKRQHHLDMPHWAAKVGREQNSGEARLLNDPTLLTATEALLNVLPPSSVTTGKKKPGASLAGAANDYRALERLRKQSFAETVPAPKIAEQIALGLAGEDEVEEDG